MPQPCSVPSCWTASPRRWRLDSLASWLKSTMVALAVFATFVPRDALALNPTRGLDQYNCRTWTREAALPVNSVAAVAQTVDGYVWLGTMRGLVRFDGTHFTPVDLEFFRGVNNGSIRSLAASRRGGLWIGFENDGLGYFDGHQIKRPNDRSWNEDHINVHTILEASDGTAWAPAAKPSPKFWRTAKSIRSSSRRICPSTTRSRSPREGPVGFGTAASIRAYRGSKRACSRTLTRTRCAASSHSRLPRTPMAELGLAPPESCSITMVTCAAPGSFSLAKRFAPC